MIIVRAINLRLQQIVPEQKGLCYLNKNRYLELLSSTIDFHIPPSTVQSRDAFHLNGLDIY